MSSKTIIVPNPNEPQAADPSRAIPAPLAQDTVIDIRELSKCYRVFPKPSDRLKQAVLGWRRRYHRDFWALRGINLQIRRGEAIGVIGRNGSGKSTLLKILAGTEEPDSGTVNSQRGLICGYLPQEFELAPDQTVAVSVREGVQPLLDDLFELESLDPDNQRAAVLEQTLATADAWSIEIGRAHV